MDATVIFFDETSGKRNGKRGVFLVYRFQEFPFFARLLFSSLMKRKNTLRLPFRSPLVYRLPHIYAVNGKRERFFFPLTPALFGGFCHA